MAATISCFFSSSPSSFQHNTNLKLRLSLDRQRVAHRTLYDKDKSCRYIHGVPKLRVRHQKPHALVPEKHDSISENIFPINKSCFHLSQNGRKPGLVPFCDLSGDNEVISSNSERSQNSESWVLGPAILVASFISPSILLPEVMLNNFGVSSLTIFVLLFFTDATFYSGVAVFLLLLDSLMRRRQPVHSANESVTLNPHLGYQISSVVTMVLSITIPIATMMLAWEWTFPLVPTTFVPHLVGIVVQFAFEQLARYWKSPSWAAISLIFHVYRFHQIHRAGNLLTYLSLEGGILGILSSVLYLLLVICVWSFSSFLMRLFLELNSNAKLT